MPWITIDCYNLTSFYLQPPQVNGGGAMFDSYNFGHTVSPEVQHTATTPGESPKAEEAFATFGDHSPNFGPASPQPKVQIIYIDFCPYTYFIYLLKDISSIFETQNSLIMD